MNFICYYICYFYLLYIYFLLFYFIFILLNIPIFQLFIILNKIIIPHLKKNINILIFSKNNFFLYMNYYYYKIHYNFLKIYIYIFNYLTNIIIVY